MFRLSRPYSYVRFVPYFVAAAALFVVAGCGQQPQYSSNKSYPKTKTHASREKIIGNVGYGAHETLQSGSYNYHRIFDRPHETYADHPEGALRATADHPLSTFGIDVDTGSYANVRRFLNRGRLPIPQAVRVEELINYFAYHYPVSQSRAKPFTVTTEIAPTPWNAHTHLLQIGLKAYDVPRAKRPAANLVFLIDVSGSMADGNKLPLLKSAFKLLIERLEPRDRNSIVTFAYDTELALDTTPGNRKDDVRTTLNGLDAHGGTNGEAGIQLAYRQAQKGFIRGGINRVILATDGDLNVGVVDFDELKALIEKRRKAGIALTTLGFGTGNYNDRLLEQLADFSNGNHAYIDTLSEAQKVLSQQMNGTLMTVAKDVKLQVEFNPAVVAEYRLIGYENRALAHRDFGNDRVDAGEIGAGHTVTALYEIALVGSLGRRLPHLRYQKVRPVKGNSDELAFVRIRYKKPRNKASEMMEFPVMKSSVKAHIDEAHPRFKLATAVAAFGQILRHGDYMGDMKLAAVVALASSALENDPEGHRREFVRLVKMAKSLRPGEDSQIGNN